MGDGTLGHHADGIVIHTGYLDRKANGIRRGKSSNGMRWNKEGRRETNRRSEALEGFSDYRCGSVTAQLDSAYGHRHCRVLVCAQGSGSVEVRELAPPAGPVPRIRQLDNEQVCRARFGIAAPAADFAIVSSYLRGMPTWNKSTRGAR